MVGEFMVGDGALHPTGRIQSCPWRRSGCGHQMISTAGQANGEASGQCKEPVYSIYQYIYIYVLRFHQHSS